MLLMESSEICTHMYSTLKHMVLCTQVEVCQASIFRVSCFLLFLVRHVQVHSRLKP